ncbi:MAG TPA: hypothetical protein VI160_10840 [Gemmatimonadales bacterium]
MEPRIQNAARLTLRGALPLALAAVAFAGTLWITAAPGPGLEPDSMSYVGAAQSLVRRGALRVPTAYWWEGDSTSALGSFPPGFSLAIAIPAALGVAPVPAARLVIAASAAVTAWALAAAAFEAGALAACLAAVLALFAPGVVNQHWIVLSEPLSYALLAVALGLMANRPDKPVRYGLVAAGANLVRYAEVACVVTAVAWAFAQQGGWGARIKRAVLAGLPAVVLQGAWLVYAKSVEARTPFAGVGEFHGVTRTVEQGIGRIGAWLVPSPVLPAWGVPLAVLLGVAILWLVHQTLRDAAPERAPAQRWLAVLLTFMAVYAGTLVFSRTFVGGAIEFDDRILSPLYLCGGAAVGAMLGLEWRKWGRQGRVATAGAIVAWAAAALVVDVGQVRDMRAEGYGYEGEDWQATDFARWLRTDGGRYEIWSNDPAAVYFLTGRPARLLPMTLAADSVRRFGATFKKRPALLVQFQDAYRESADGAVLARDFGLAKVQEFEYGRAWADTVAR